MVTPLTPKDVRDLDARSAAWRRAIVRFAVGAFFFVVAAIPNSEQPGWFSLVLGGVGGFLFAFAVMELLAWQPISSRPVSGPDDRVSDAIVELDAIGWHLATAGHFECQPGACARLTGVKIERALVKLRSFNFSGGAR